MGRDYTQAANEWADSNTLAWEWMVREARTLAREGLRFGMKALAEHVRWVLRTQPGPRVDYKVNNNYIAPLARRLVAEAPEVAPYLTMRQTAGDSREATR